MIGLPPFELPDDQIRPTMPDAVMAALFAKLRGALGIDAALMDTSLE
jgi:hypothetical protein